jgi:hypothetical protein
MSEAAIKKKFHRLSLKAHPDKGGDSANFLRLKVTSRKDRAKMTWRHVYYESITSSFTPFVLFHRSIYPSFTFVERLRVGIKEAKTCRRQNRQKRIS